MKKLITIDAIMAALIGGLGYGIGYMIPELWGFNAIICFIICMVVGMVVDGIVDKILYNSFVQSNTRNKCYVFVGILIFFLIVYFGVERIFGKSLLDEVNEEIAFVTVIPAIGFCISYCVRYIKKYRLSKKYGSGEGGFVIDQKSIESIKALQGENRKLSEYSGKDPVAKAVSGTYIGKKDNKGVRFLGINYAKAERFKRAVQAEDSDDIFEAYYFGSSVIQPDNSHNVLAGLKQDDDCLNLNIWTAKYTPEEKKPVVVYFHGGDGRYGGCANPLYYLDNIAKGISNAVFVSVNYRFGVLGVVDFSKTDAPDKDNYKDSTALSLFDQIEALKWIKKNIAAFGGDPDHITLVGDSAGGSDICLLAAAKEAKGLFKRALILCASTNDTPPAGDIRASMLGEKLLEEFHAKSVAELKKLTSEQLKDFSAKYYNLIELPPRNGVLIPMDLKKEYLGGVASDIEFIFGIADDDVSGWEAMLTGDVSFDAMVESYYEDFKNYVGVDKLDKLDELLQAYKKVEKNDIAAKKALMADYSFKACILQDCRTLAMGGSKVRCFFWNVNGDIEKLTANAVSMITSILGNMGIAEQMGYIHDKNITEIMQALLGKYFSGEPVELFNNEINGVSQIIWEEYEPEMECVLHVQKNKIEMAQHLFSDNIYAIEKIVE